MQLEITKAIASAWLIVENLDPTHSDGRIKLAHIRLYLASQLQFEDTYFISAALRQVSYESWKQGIESARENLRSLVVLPRD